MLTTALALGLVALSRSSAAAHSVQAPTESLSPKELDGPKML